MEPRWRGRNARVTAALTGLALFLPATMAVAAGGAPAVGAAGGASSSSDTAASARGDGAEPGSEERDRDAEQDYAGYLFAYFAGEGYADGEQVYFGLSEGNDPLHYQDLNGNQPVLTSAVGEQGVRDPFIIRSPENDRFYMIATDLRIHGNGDWDGAQRHGSRSIVVWESEDLITWSDERLVEVSPPEAGNTWAPEAYWDEEQGRFVVFWASKLYAEDDPDHTGDSYNRMMYATTSDFTTFSEPRVWVDPGYSVIDSTVARDDDGTYYRFTKDERNNTSTTPCSKFILSERSDTLTDTDWDFVTECIGKENSLGGGIERGEGPTIFRSNDSGEWYLFIDEFGGQGYVPFVADSLDAPQWRKADDFTMPSRPRHGTVLPVTADEYERLLEHYGDGAQAEEPQDDAAGSPVLPGLWADPNIVQFDDRYYLYATTDGHPGWGGKEFYAWTSKDLAEWERTEEPILTLDGANGDVPWATGNAWAPTIAERDGKYYFYFSGHHPGLDRKTIGVAVADSPTGPFTAEPEPMITNDEPVTTGQAIDPAWFRDPVSGKHYLFWGNGGPLYAELNDDMVSVDESTIRPVEGLPDFREGLFVNHRDGKYHLTYSIDDTGSEDYRVGYATSSSIDGPWTYRGLLLEKDPSLGIVGTGHSSILNVSGTDDWYIAYHRHAIPDGDGTHRETTIDRIEVDDDGLFRPVTPTLESIEPID